MTDEIKTVRGGAFCSPIGGTALSAANTPMVCSIKDGATRARWRRSGPTPKKAPSARRTAGTGGGSNSQARPSLIDATKTQEPLVHLDPTPKPTLVDPTRHSNRPPQHNNWGGFTRPPGEQFFHGDGEYGRAIDSLGPDATIDMGDGEPLRDTLGNIASDVATLRTHPQEGLDRLKAVRDRLPEGTRARQVVDRLVAATDAPDTPMPELPEGTPASVVNLVRDLHAIPACRQARAEEIPLALEVAKKVAARPRAIIDYDIRRIHDVRHEMDSDRGRQHITQAIQRAIKATDEERRAARRQS